MYGNNPYVTTRLGSNKGDTDKKATTKGTTNKEDTTKGDTIKEGMIRIMGEGTGESIARMTGEIGKTGENGTEGKTEGTTEGMIGSGEMTVGKGEGLMTKEGKGGVPTIDAITETTATSLVDATAKIVRYTDELINKFILWVSEG